MRKIILIAFASFMAFSAESVAMEGNIPNEEKILTKRKLEDKEGSNEEDLMSHQQNKKKLKRSSKGILFSDDLVNGIISEAAQEVAKEVVKIDADGFKIPIGRSPRKLSDIRSAQVSQKASSKNLRPAKKIESVVKIFDHINTAEKQEFIEKFETHKEILETSNKKSPTRTKGQSTNNLFQKEKPTFKRENGFSCPRISYWEDFLT